MTGNSRTTGQQENAVITCVNCGKELDEFTGVPAAEDWYKDTRFVHYCRDCQEAYFEELSQKTSPHLALFYCCVAFNIPMVPMEIPNMDDVSTPWLAYLENLRRSGRLEQDNGEPSTFFDGIVDILKLFGGDLSSGEVAKAIQLEKNIRDTQQGNQRQRKVWGTIDGFTSAQYVELDRLYAIQSKPYEAAGIDAMMEYNLREICKNLLRYSLSNAEGEAAMASAYLKQAEIIKASNLMRKKDEKPVEDLRIDTIVDKLEKKGFLKNGRLLGYSELLKKLQGEHPHYPHSKDAADQMLLCINNTMRKNMGLGIETELPEAMRFDAMPDEFEEEAPQWERDIKAKLGLFPLSDREREGPGAAGP